MKVAFILSSVGLFLTVQSQSFAGPRVNDFDIFPKPNRKEQQNAIDHYLNKLNNEDAAWRHLGFDGLDGFLEKWYEVGTKTQVIALFTPHLSESYNSAIKDLTSKVTALDKSSTKLSSILNSADRNPNLLDNFDFDARLKTAFQENKNSIDAAKKSLEALRSLKIHLSSDEIKSLANFKGNFSDAWINSAQAGQVATETNLNNKLPGWSDGKDLDAIEVVAWINSTVEDQRKFADKVGSEEFKSISNKLKNHEFVSNMYGADIKNIEAADATNNEKLNALENSLSRLVPIESIPNAQATVKEERLKLAIDFFDKPRMDAMLQSMDDLQSLDRQISGGIKKQLSSTLKAFSAQVSVFEKAFPFQDENAILAVEPSEAKDHKFSLDLFHQALTNEDHLSLLNSKDAAALELERSAVFDQAKSFHDHFSEFFINPHSKWRLNFEARIANSETETVTFSKQQTAYYKLKEVFVAGNSDVLRLYKAGEIVSANARFAKMVSDGSPFFLAADKKDKEVVELLSKYSNLAQFLAQKNDLEEGGEMLAQTKGLLTNFNLLDNPQLNLFGVASLNAKHLPSPTGQKSKASLEKLNFDLLNAGALPNANNISSVPSN